MHHLYWIHLDEHTDPHIEGYIGVSTQPEIRFRQHTTDTANRAGSKVIRKIVEEVGVEKLRHTLLASFTDREEARIAERNYRPKTNIGWNLWVGGGVSPDCSGRIASDETRKKRAESIKRTKSKRSYVSPFKGMTERHSQKTKDLIGSYHKGKTISEAHRQAISEKLRGKSKKAMPISLMNIETDVVRNFSCIREASEELGINYQTLRSAVRLQQQIVHRRWKILR